MIVSPRGLSDLWLYIYHVDHPNPDRTQSSVSKTRSLFSHHSNGNGSNGTNPMVPIDPSPSHATSLPNTLATSSVMSRQHSVQSLFPDMMDSARDSAESIGSSTPTFLNNHIHKQTHSTNLMNDQNQPNTGNTAVLGYNAVKSSGSEESTSSSEAITT